MRNILIIICIQLLASAGFSQMNPEVLKGDYADYFKKVESAINNIPGLDDATKDDLKRRVTYPSTECTLTVRTYEYDKDKEYWKSINTDYPAQYKMNDYFEGIPFPLKEQYSVTTPEVSASVSYTSGKWLFKYRDVDILGTEMVIMERKSGVALKIPYLHELGSGVSGDDPQDYIYNYSEVLTIAKQGKADQMFEHLTGDVIYPSCHFGTDPNDCPVDKNYIFKCKEIKENVLGTAHLKMLEGHEPIKF